jgi:hypothetical protein
MAIDTIETDVLAQLLSEEELLLANRKRLDSLVKITNTAYRTFSDMIKPLTNDLVTFDIGADAKHYDFEGTKLGDAKPDSKVIFEMRRVAYCAREFPTRRIDEPSLCLDFTFSMLKEGELCLSVMVSVARGSTLGGVFSWESKGHHSGIEPVSIQVMLLEACLELQGVIPDAILALDL